MPYEIVLGREEKQKEKYGTQASVYLGKQYVKMGQTTTLSMPVYLDADKAHVVFVCGKRGTGKSYVLGVIAEGLMEMQEYSDQVGVILLDTMGVYWTMKYPNQPDAELLRQWGLEGKGLNNVAIYTPQGYYQQYKDQGIPTDKPFAIKPSEISPEDWWRIFSLKPTEPMAVFIERIILELNEKMQDKYSIQDIIDFAQADTEEETHVKQATINRFKSTNEWGLFSEKSTPLKELSQAKQITVLDMSPYALMPNGWEIKNLAIGIICNKLFTERMKTRKEEEYSSIKEAVHFIARPTEQKEKMPMTWIMLDEAHEMLPKDGETSATSSLITLLREGRQPGIALVLATQQPGKIHTDAMTQSDIIISHRLTAKTDVDALKSLLQTYLSEAIDEQLANLPKISGAALAMDDVNERIYPIQIRPRASWHGGSAPGLIKNKKIF